MGAWGTGNFDNDDGLDWIYELEESVDVSFVSSTLGVITQQEGEYLEATECARALAAAEVVAALMNAASASLPDAVAQWISSHQGVNGRDYAPLALKAVERIKTNSELKELWDESDSATEWYDVLQDLERRLRR